MKKFIISALCTAVFFIGIGGLIEKATANFKSDARALELIRQARAALGGDAAINNVRAMTIIANTTETFAVEGVQRSEMGSMEINLELPNKFSKQLRIGSPDAVGGEFKKEVNVIVMRQPDGNAEWKTESGDTVNFGGKQNFVVKTDARANGEPTANGRKKVFVIKNDDNDSENVENRKVIINHDGAGAMGGSELFRTVFALLLTAPDGTDVSYTDGGASSVDGFACDVVVAQTAGNSFKLFLDQSSHLPRMISFQGLKPFVFKVKTADNGGAPEKDVKVFVQQNRR